MSFDTALLYNNILNESTMRIFFLCCVAVFSLLSCKTEVNDVGNVPERGFHSNRPANIWE